MEDLSKRHHYNQYHLKCCPSLREYVVHLRYICNKKKEKADRVRRQYQIEEDIATRYQNELHFLERKAYNFRVGPQVQEYIDFKKAFCIPAWEIANNRYSELLKIENQIDYLEREIYWLRMPACF